MKPQDPFADVVLEDGGFSIPELKWRELLFVGAMKRDGEGYVREPDRQLPPFAQEGLFPPGVPLMAIPRNGRVLLRRLIQDPTT